ncbi:hypothetical protein [Motiliproteus sediminis]|uniref:hypothetical protein n=1 Tax=Motiliproteus sediminis TaxID=1468178 RepID=UPI001AEFEAEB|nr:hypothetical protein [Motiliproteus sediminis]
MLTYEDCLELCELNQNEIDAIAEHEHIDRLQALAVGDHLVHCRGGETKIRKMIIDDIRHAQRHGDRSHEVRLRQALGHFIKTHPHQRSPGRL